MTEPRPAEERQDEDGGQMLRFSPPAAGWVPPAEAGRAILRVILAVKRRRDANRKDAA
jgi:hypothetical protein